MGWIVEQQMKPLYFVVDNFSKHASAWIVEQQMKLLYFVVHNFSKHASANFFTV